MGVGGVGGLRVREEEALKGLEIWEKNENRTRILSKHCFEAEMPLPHVR